MLNNIFIFDSSDRKALFSIEIDIVGHTDNDPKDCFTLEDTNTHMYPYCVYCSTVQSTLQDDLYT